MAAAIAVSPRFGVEPMKCLISKCVPSESFVEGLGNTVREWIITLVHGLRSDRFIFAVYGMKIPRDDTVGVVGDAPQEGL